MGHAPSIPALETQRLVDVCVRGQPGLQNVLQDNRGNMERRESLSLNCLKFDRFPRGVAFGRELARQVDR